MASQRPSIAGRGNDLSSAIVLSDSDSDGTPVPPIKPASTARRRGNATAGSSRGAAGGANLDIPRMSRAISQISIGTSSGAPGSPVRSADPKPPRRKEERPKPSSSSSSRTRDPSRGSDGAGGGPSKKIQPAKGKVRTRDIAYSGPDIEEELVRARSSSQVQKAINKTNVIEILDSDDEDDDHISPPRAGPSTHRARPSQSLVKPRSSPSAAVPIPHAQPELHRKVSSPPSSLSPIFIPPTAVPPGSQAKRPANGQGKKRISIRNEEHVSVSPESDFAIVRPAAEPRYQADPGSRAVLDLTSSSSSSSGRRMNEGSRPALAQAEADEGIKANQERDGPVSSPPPASHPTIARRPKRPPSPLLADNRPKLPPGAKRRPLSPSPANPRPTVQANGVRTSVTAPTLFPQSSQAGPSTHAAALERYMSPDSVGPPRSSDPLDSIPRPATRRARPGGEASDLALSDFDMGAGVDGVTAGQPPVEHPNPSRAESDGDILMSSPIPRPADLTENQVEQAIVDATAAVDDVAIADAGASTPAVDAPLPSAPELGKIAKKIRDKFAGMTRAEKIAFIKNDGRFPGDKDGGGRNGGEEMRNRRSPIRDADPSVDQDGLTISSRWEIKTGLRPKARPVSAAVIGIPSSPGPHSEADSKPRPVPGPEHPPPEYRGTVKRSFESDSVDAFNFLRPKLTHNPALHRQIFQDWMSKCSAGTNPHAKEIGVINTTTDGGGAAPEMEYQYGNEMLYHPDVPDTDTGSGCGCIGPCDPKDRSCRCVRRQELYFYATMLTGFAYNEGRSKTTELDLFKTKAKGWGVRARYAIPVGTFLGVYSGEMIPDYESERRGHLYNQIGRTYLFDCDGWQIRNPPDLDKLREVDPRLADLAEQSVRRFRAVAERAGEAEMDYYSAYSVDAFHYGFTRYFNHSCDPNLAITQAYVGDYHPERPKLVMFTRRPIVAGEEMCISYMGIPDDDDDIPVQPVVVQKLPSKRSKAGRRQKNKTSATAHVAMTVKPGEGKCKCQAWNCKGTMFSIDVRADGAD